MSKNSIKNIIFVLAIIAAIFFCYQSCNKGSQLSDFKNQISQFTLKEKAFIVQRKADSSQIVIQNQTILSQKDAMNQGLLDIEKWKSIKSQVTVITNTIIDSIIIPIDTAKLLQLLDNELCLMLPYDFNKKDKWYTIAGFIDEKAMHFSTISFPDTIKYTIGDEKRGFLKQPAKIVKVEFANPHVVITGMSNIVIENPKKLVQKNGFWYAVGLASGIVLVHFVK